MFLYLQWILSFIYFQSYISCVFGIQMVGFVMASYGCATTLSALVTSRIAKYTGRYFLFGTAASINMAIFIILYIWVPTPDQQVLVFILAVTWGLGEGMWQTQSNGKWLLGMWQTQSNGMWLLIISPHFFGECI